MSPLYWRFCTYTKLLFEKIIFRNLLNKKTHFFLIAIISTPKTNNKIKIKNKTNKPLDFFSVGRFYDFNYKDIYDCLYKNL
jgi:hypothetical protein